MEELQTRHRKEQRDLQSRITQKKKQASKKTRKGVNDECARLEAELQAQQRQEVAALTGEGPGVDAAAVDALSPAQLERLTLRVDGDDDDNDDMNQAPSSDGPGDAHNGSHGSPSSSVGDAATAPSPVPPAPSPAAATAATARKPNRQKARLARRAAEHAEVAAQAAREADALPDRKTQERTRMLAAMTARQLREVEVRADGHCLYSAVADQLAALDVPLSAASAPASALTSSSAQQEAGDAHAVATATTAPAYKTVRAAAAAYIAAHADDFLPFLEEPLDAYVSKVRDTGEWGGQLELLALAASYRTPINVLQDFARVERIEPPHSSSPSAVSADADASIERKEMWLGYYKHGFGLGEHYNSLRKVG